MKESYDDAIAIIEQYDEKEPTFKENYKEKYFFLPEGRQETVQIAKSVSLPRMVASTIRLHRCGENRTIL